MIVTRKSISRRTVLRGVGATVGLPLLDAMVPAFATAATTPPTARRLGVVYHPMASSTINGCQPAPAPVLNSRLRWPG
jgi:hypothetical protein